MFYTIFITEKVTYLKVRQTMFSCKFFSGYYQLYALHKWFQNVGSCLKQPHGGQLQLITCSCIYFSILLQMRTRSHRDKMFEIVNEVPMFFSYSATEELGSIPQIQIQIEISSTNVENLIVCQAFFYFISQIQHSVYMQ